MAEALHTNAADLLTWPAYLVQAGLFWTSARNTGQRDREHNAQALAEMNARMARRGY